MQREALRGNGSRLMALTLGFIRATDIVFNDPGAHEGKHHNLILYVW